MIRDKLIEFVGLQDVIKTYNLRYKSKSRKVYNFSEYFSIVVFFFKYIHEGHLSLKDSDYEQSNFPIKIKNWDKGKKKTIGKDFFK